MMIKKDTTQTLRQKDHVKEMRKKLRELGITESSMYSKKENLGKMKNIAWAFFSFFIRQRDFKKYGGKCYTCQKVAESVQDLQAGHYQSRGKAATLYNEINNHAQCRACNHPAIGNGKPRTYSYNLNQEYGEGTSDELYRLSEQYQKNDFWWHLETANKYYEKLKAKEN